MLWKRLVIAWCFSGSSSSNSSSSNSSSYMMSTNSIFRLLGIVLVFFVFVLLIGAARAPSSSSYGVVASDRMVTVPNTGFTVTLQQLQQLYLPQVSNSYALISPNAVPTSYMKVPVLPIEEQLTIVVTGGAGFVGSHLVDRLMLMGHYVIVLDNFFTGRRSNVAHWIGHPNFELIRHDVINPIDLQADRIYHLASPASPPHYQFDRINTIKTNSIGTMNLLELAAKVGARFLLASTSEVYGDPEVSPQAETYWGNVNPIGPRACYDESKRLAETATYAYQERYNVPIRIVRIFNTFGPRMSEDDGRVVSNFIIQAHKRQPITVYGQGDQTRSFQYVHDLVSGLIALMESNCTKPVNIGNPEQFTIMEFAEMIRANINPSLPIVQKPAVVDDPQKRKPDISRAMKELRWKPQFSVAEGIAETSLYYKYKIDQGLA